MLARATLRFRLALAVLLAAIGIQAIPAHALPMRPDHGSAFSASSEEVSLSARRAGVGEIRLAPMPLPAPRPEVVAEAAVVGAPEAPWPATYATGPPLRPIPLVHGPAPRAPPAAS
jgi:hypothetical protein